MKKYNSTLPILDFVDDLFSKTKFEDTIVIASQHILETNYIMFEHLFDKGLRPKNTFLIGKCYSTSKKILKKFQNKGVFVHKGSTYYEGHGSFDEQFDNQMIDFLKTIKNKFPKNYSRIILIDDGGYLVYWANNLLKDFKRIVAVEQTSSGYIKLKNLKLNFPVINVARSEAKLFLESPFIAEKIIENLNKSFSKLKLNPKTILIIGNGAVGQNISKLLSKKYQIRHYDQNNKFSDFKNSDLSKILGKFDVIIGCTGSPVISQEHFNTLKKGVVLASASSSDREFSAFKLRKLIKKTKDCHKDLKINGIYLLNSGFPVNFDGKENSVLPEKIQLTRALILSATCLANQFSYPNKIIPLNEKLQNQIVVKFKTLLKIK